CPLPQYSLLPIPKYDSALEFFKSIFTKPQYPIGSFVSLEQMIKSFLVLFVDILLSHFLVPTIDIGKSTFNVFLTSSSLNQLTLCSTSLSSINRIYVLLAFNNINLSILAYKVNIIYLFLRLSGP